MVNACRTIKRLVVAKQAHGKDKDFLWWLLLFSNEGTVLCGRMLSNNVEGVVEGFTNPCFPTHRKTVDSGLCSSACGTVGR